MKRNKLEGTSASAYLFYAASGSGADAVRYNDADGGDYDTTDDDKRQ